MWNGCRESTFSRSEKRILRSWPSIWMELHMEHRIIISDPHVMMGKPVIAGTRITVERILERLAAGDTAEIILQAYPRLTPEAIPAAIAVAARALRADVVYPLAEAIR